MFQDMRLFAEDTRAISNTYSNALKSAESLVERDVSELQQGFRIYEQRYAEEKNKVEIATKAVKEKTNTINHLESSLKDVVNILGGFLQDHICDWLETQSDQRTQAVLQVLSDYGKIPSSSSVRYVRITEAAHNKNLASIQEGQTLVQRYRAIAQCQATTIKQQSEQMDRHLDKYEQCLRQVREQTNQVSQLRLKRTELEQKVSDYETTLSRAQTVVAERQRLQDRNSDIEQKLQETIKIVERREAQITELQAQLAKAQDDTRRVIIQSQEMFPQPEMSDTSSQTSNNTAKPLAEKSKPKGWVRRSPLTTQAKLKFLGPPLFSDLMSTPPESAASAVQTVTNRKLSKNPSLASGSSSIYSRGSNDNEIQNDPFHEAQPRTDSLGALENKQSARPVTGVDIQKQLPTPPPTIVATPSQWRNGDNSYHGSPMPKSSTYSNFHVQAPHSPQVAGRRVLSNIPEAEGEDRESPGARSTTSSDREMYRRSMHAFNALNSYEGKTDQKKAPAITHSAGDLWNGEQSSAALLSQMASKGHHGGRRLHSRP